MPLSDKDAVKKASAELLERVEATMSGVDWPSFLNLAVLLTQAKRTFVTGANRAADVLEAENRIRTEIREQDSTLAKVVNLKRWEKKGPGEAIG
jgi:hypothetical protein